MLVGVRVGQQEEREVEEYLEELAALVDTYGAEIVDQHIVRIDKPQPRFYIGSGNAEEIAQRCHEQEIDLIVFDEELSPSQQRNWEKVARMTVVDRQEIILDIFASRASTREAVLQIELAQAEYALPRLKRAWTHLHRQQGGLGIRGGEGEKQIEVDARLVRRRIVKLKEELETVRRRRAEQRKQRRKRPVPNAAIVGYTNAGKSSLFNRLTQSDVLVENKLFATLDPTTRRLRLPNNQVLLLTDTVGFVRKLPHDLVEAFKATLEEAAIGDFLIHIVDASSHRAVEHYETTLKVLDEIGAKPREMMTVFNKIDLVEQPFEIFRLRRRFPEAHFISVHTGEGLDELIAAAQQLIQDEMTQMYFRFPPHRYELVANLHRTAKVLSERHNGEAIFVKASVPPESRRELAEYQVSAEEVQDVGEAYEVI